MSCQRMSHAMRTLEGNTETAFPNCGLKGVRDGRALQHAYGSAHSQEDPAVRRGRWRPLQMVHQPRGNIFWQGEFPPPIEVFFVGFETTLSPIKILPGC